MQHIKLPAMKCDKGCGECCGPVPCTEAEYQRVIQYAKNNNIQPKDQGLTCPFYQDGICKVYEVRPLLCHLFGHTEKLKCCRGYNTNISPKHAKKIMTQYINNPKNKHNKLLHDCLKSE